MSFHLFQLLPAKIYKVDAFFGEWFVLMKILSNFWLLLLDEQKNRAKKSPSRYLSPVGTVSSISQRKFIDIDFGVKQNNFQDHKR